MDVPPDQLSVPTLGYVNIPVRAMQDIRWSFPVVMWINMVVVRRLDSPGVLPPRRVKCMVIVCLQWSTIPAVMWINMVVLDPLAIRGVIHSKNVSVRLIRSVHLSLHRSIRVFRVVMSLINMAVVLRRATRTVP